MTKLPIKIGKYGVEITSDGRIIFYDLRAEGVVTEPPYGATIFWKGAIGDAIEDLAQGYDSLARILAISFPDMAVKSRLNTYQQYACMYGRHQDYRNWYGVYLYYGNSSRDHIVIKSVNGTITELGYENVDLGTAYWYWVKFEITGTTINSYRATDPVSDVPDTPQISVTDTDIADGRWGIRHWGLGGRGLHGLYLFFEEPTSEPSKPLKYFEIPIDEEGKGTFDNPFKPKMPHKIKVIDKVTVLEPERYRVLRERLKGYLPEDAINGLAEALGYIVTREIIDEYACTISTLLPTPKGKPADNIALVRIFDVKTSEVIDEIRRIGGRELSRDEALKMAKKLDDRLHDYDLLRCSKSDAEKVAKEYIEWRKSIFGVEMLYKIALRYVQRYKGW